MKVSEYEAEHLRQNARAAGHFMVALHNFGAKLDLAESPEAFAERKRIIAKIIVPLVDASSEVLLYGSDCMSETWP